MYSLRKGITAAMRKTGILMLSLLLAVGAMLSGCAQQDPDVPEGMQLASSEDADYLFYVPEGWRLDKSSLFTSAYFSSGDATSISATAFSMNLTDTSIDDWWERYKGQFEGIYENVEFSDGEETKLGGEDAMKYTISATLNETDYQYIIVAALRDSYIYYITYTSTPEYYEDHLEALDQVIEYFAFK